MWPNLLHFKWTVHTTMWWVRDFPRKIIDFYIPQGEVFVIKPTMPYSIELPPHITVVGFTTKGKLYYPPANWLGPIKNSIYISKRMFYQFYIPALHPVPSRYGMCINCGFNSIVERLCIRCVENDNETPETPVLFLS